PVATLDAALGASAPPAASVAGSRMTVDLGDVTNADRDDGVAEVITLDWDTIVRNNTNTNRGDAAIVAAALTTGDGVSISADSDPLRVLEPELQTQVSLSVASGDAGDPVTVTVRVEHAEGSDATAHDVVVAAFVPFEFEGATNLRHVDGVVPTVATIVSGSVSLRVPALAVGEFTEMQFDATITATAPIGGVVDALSETTWTSLPGAVNGSQSPYASDALERTGAQSPPWNDYFVEGSSQLQLRPAAGTLVRRGSGAVTPGDVVTWDAEIAVPEGRRDELILTNQLPDGLAFVSIASFSASGELTCDGGACMLPEPVVSDAGHRVEWSLGTVINNNRDNAAAEPIRFAITAVVTNEAGAVRGAQLANRLQIAGLDLAADPLVVREPTLTLTPSFSSPTADAGDAIQLTWTIAHDPASDSAAYEPALDAPLPSGVTVDPGSLVSTCPGTPSLTGGRLSWTAVSFAVGSSCTLTWSGVVDASRVFGADITLPSGALTWSGQSGDLRTSRSSWSPLGVERTGSVNDPGGVANTYRASVGATLTVPDVAMSLVELDTTADATGDGEIGAGEQATLRYRVTLPQGRTNELGLRFELPDGVRVVGVELDDAGFAGTLGADPSTQAASAPGETLRWSFGPTSLAATNQAGSSSFDVVVHTEGVLDPLAWGRDDLAWVAALELAGQDVATEATPVRVVHA
ncbi:MAG TPA: hypothetical protein PKA64_22285, partial [Myxococcota bacterium]|nr:hypothetical protein [Myxococcota bacterium]